MDHGSRVAGAGFKITKVTLPTPCAWWAELPRRASHPTACLSSRRHRPGCFVMSTPSVVGLELLA